MASIQIPYMIDLHLYLGRPLQMFDSTAKLEKIDDMAPYYGSLPAGMLEADIEWVKEKVAASGELKAALNGAENATKLYLKTRAVASPESVQRAKELGFLPVHPLCM